MKVKSRMISWIVCVSLLMGLLWTAADAEPFSTGEIPGGGQVWSSAVYGAYGYAVVGNGSENGLYIIDNIDSQQIAFGDRINSDGIVTDKRNVYVTGDNLFYSSNDRLYRYQVSETPEAPAVVAQYDAYRAANYITSQVIDGKEYVYVCHNSGIAVFDLSKPADAAPVNLSLGKVTVAGFSDTNIYVYNADNKIVSYSVTYEETVTAEKKGEQVLSGEHAIGDPGTAVYLDGYICISGKAGSKDNPNGGSILMVDAELLDQGEISTYRYYSRGSQTAQQAANLQMIAMDVYNGLLMAVERCHNAPPSKVFALDISDPANPVRVWEKDVIGGPVNMFIHNDTLYLSARDAAYQVVPIDIGPFCKMTVPKAGEKITAFPFTVAGTAAGADTVSLDLRGSKIEVPVAADGSWSYAAAYYENGSLTVQASVDTYSCTRTVYIDVPAELTLTCALTQDGVPQEALPAGDVLLDVTAANNTAAEQNAMLYAALYQGDEIVSLEQVPVTLAADAEQTVLTGRAYSINAAALAESTLKVFAVASTGDAVLLSNTVVFVPVDYAPPSTDKTAAGEEDINIDIEPDHAAVQAEIWGTVQNGPDRTVLLTVYQPDAAGLEGIDYINAVKTNSQGSFSIRYSLGTPAIEEQAYTVKAAMKGLDGVWRFNGEDDTFQYYGPSYQQRALAAVNGAEADSVIETIEEYNLVFGISLGADSDYAALGSGSFYQKNVRDALAAQAFQAVSAVKPYFTSEVARQQLLKTINEEQDSAAVRTLIEQPENAVLLGIDSSYLYPALEDDEKTAVAQAVLQGRKDAPYQTAAAFLESYEQCCAVAYINSVSYTGMGNALKAANKTLQLDLAGTYATLDDVEDELIYAHKVLDRTVFKTVDEIRTVFASAVKTAAGNKGGSGSGNGGHSGGGGGSGIISVLPSPDTETEPLQPIPDTETEQTVQFTDLEETHWAKPYIDRLVKERLVSGYADGSIRPDAQITRAEFIKLLMDAYKLTDENYVSSFNDVQKEGKFYDWYYNSVATAQALGLVAGDENGNFNPNACITRQDMAVILYKMYQKQGIEPAQTAVSYVDAADIAAYARESVDAVTALGIMRGVGENTFAPYMHVTRAMAFTVIVASMDMQ